MPTKLENIIYGKKKDIGFNAFNAGNLLKAISNDLEEFGEKGVQGVVTKLQDANNIIAYSKKADLKSPYIMAGLCKKDLVLVVRDDANDKFEQMAVVVKGYADIKESLANSTGAVVNANEGDKIIDRASQKQANKFGTTVQGEDDTDFGGITGNILICAHGRPQVNAGRVIGVAFGKKTPEQIADILTAGDDQSTRLAKDYDGKITLSGCFTASGGPEALKADDPFAKKVWELLKQRGYTKCSVVGIPGVAMTASAGDEDDNGEVMKEGDKGAWVRSEEMLKALDKKAGVLRGEIDKLVEGVVKIAKSSKGDTATFLQSEQAKKVLEVIAGKEKALNSLKEEMLSIVADQKKYGDVDGKLLANVTGTFGLRVIQQSLN